MCKWQVNSDCWEPFIIKIALICRFLWTFCMKLLHLCSVSRWHIKQTEEENSTALLCKWICTEEKKWMIKAHKNSNGQIWLYLYKWKLLWTLMDIPYLYAFMISCFYCIINNVYLCDNLPHLVWQCVLVLYWLIDCSRGL